MRAASTTRITMERIGTTAMKRYATISRFRRLQSSLLLHQPMKRRTRYSPASTARYSKKLKTPPLLRRTSTSSPITTMAEQTTSSHDRRLQTSFRLASSGFMGLQSEEILYLKMRLHAGLSAPEPE